MQQMFGGGGSLVKIATICSVVFSYVYFSSSLSPYRSIFRPLYIIQGDILTLQ